MFQVSLLTRIHDIESMFSSTMARHRQNKNDSSEVRQSNNHHRRHVNSRNSRGILRFMSARKTKSMSPNIKLTALVFAGFSGSKLDVDVLYRTAKYYIMLYNIALCHVASSINSAVARMVHHSEIEQHSQEKGDAWDAQTRGIVPLPKSPWHTGLRNFGILFFSGKWRQAKNYEEGVLGMVHHELSGSRRHVSRRRVPSPETTEPPSSPKDATRKAIGNHNAGER
jgi:hypothetical protein